MNKKLIFLLFILFRSFPAISQETERFFFNFDRSNGLASDHIECITQDQKGFIWLGTTEGLVRYDGYHFRTFRHRPDDSSSLSCNYISYVLAVENNKLLVGTYDCGINIFDTETERSERIYNDTNASGKTGDNRVLCFFRDRQKRIWVGLNDGSLNLFDLEAKRVFPLKTKPTNQQSDFKFCHGFSEHLYDTNLMWIGTSSGLVLFNKNNFSYRIFRYTDQFPDAGKIFNRCRYPLQVDKANVWMGSWGGGILHFNCVTLQWEKFLINDTPPLNGGKNIVISITLKSGSELWITTHDSGAGIFDMQKKTIRFLDHRKIITQGISKGIAKYVFTDKEKNLWIGFSTGLTLYDNRQIPIEKFTLPLPTKTNLKQLHYPFYFLEDSLKNGIWVAPFHGDGLHFYDNSSGRWTQFPLPEILLPRGMIWDNENKILLLTANDLLEFDTHKKQYKQVALPDTIDLKKYAGYSLIRSKKGLLYIGTANYGFFEWKKGSTSVNHFYHRENAPGSLLENGPVYDLHEDVKGNIWVGLEKGASVLKITESTFTHFSYTHTPDLRPFKGISSFASTTDGKVWMSTISSGLVCADPFDNYRVVKGFDMSDGLISGTIYSMDKTDDGFLLLFTPKGLQFFDPLNRKSAYLGTANAYPFTPDVWEVLRVVNDHIYIGLLNGFARIRKNDLKLPRQPNIPVISLITVFDKKFLPEENSGRQIHFDHKQNFIRLFFTGFDFPNSSIIRLNYILKGLSNDTFFTEKGTNQIALTGLAPGTYELVVWSSYPESNTCSETGSWTIVIVPPWWQTWWFILCVVSVFLLLIYVLYNYRLRQAREKNKLRHQLAEMENTALRAQMNPHFLFNSLNSVNFYIQNNEPVKASVYLKKFSKLVRHILNNSRKTTVTLEDELEALLLYLELEEMRFSKHFTYRIFVSPHIYSSDIVIPPLLLQPYVENAIWHGVMQKENGGNVLIEITEKDDLFTFVIEDNGIGREKARELKSKSALEHKSHGMEITGERIRLFNATHRQNIEVVVTDLKNDQLEAAGTRVTITYKRVYR